MALLPAGRGEVFAQLFSVLGSDLVEALDEAAHIPPARLFERYGDLETVTWCGEGSIANRELILSWSENRDWTIAPQSNDLATHVARLAFTRFTRNQFENPFATSSDLRPACGRAVKGSMTSAPAQIIITRMTEHDLLEVVEIEEASGLSRWGWAAYYAELQGTNRDLMLIARMASSPIIEHQRIAGYIVARESAGELHINNVAVREQYRRRGIGSLLMGQIMETARRLKVHVAFLEVRSGNQAAQALYERTGFKAIARRPDYYSDPREDAVVMSLTLGEH